MSCELSICHIDFIYWYCEHVLWAEHMPHWLHILVLWACLVSSAHATLTSLFKNKSFYWHNVYNSLSEPSHLTDMCIPVSMTTGRSRLQSCSCRDLRIPRCRLSRYGSHSFAVSGPAAWNSSQQLFETYLCHIPASVVVLKLNCSAEPMASTYHSRFVIALSYKNGRR